MTRTLFLRTPRGVVPICRACGERLRIRSTGGRDRHLGPLVIRYGCDRAAWCDATWSPLRARHRVTGKVGPICVHVSAGCAHCWSGSGRTGRS